MKPVTTAVFPVAGIGSRFFPITKTVPKELLPILDKPLIQYAVDEVVAAGIDRLIFITGDNKEAISNYFSVDNRLESILIEKQEIDKLAKLKEILPDHVSCQYIQQSAPLGLGHAVLCARDAVGDEPFMVILPDDLIDDGTRGVSKQMVSYYHQCGHSVIAVQNIPKENVQKYGVVSLTLESKRILDIVEKPTPSEAPSTLAVVGRYLFMPGIFEYLQTTHAGVGGEIQLTDAIARFSKMSPVDAYEFEGRRYDCGEKSGHLKAMINYAMKDSCLAEEIKNIK